VGFARRVDADRSCLKRHSVRPFGAGGRFPTLASRIDNPAYAAVLRDCPVDFGAGLGHPLSRTARKIIHAYVVCVAEHGYKLPVPNTSGNGPVFRAGTERILRYHTTARDCGSILRA
jgi:hypothetical protein